MLPTRAELPLEGTADLTSLFATPDHWQREYAAVEALLPGLERFRGRLSESPAVLKEWMAASEAVDRRATNLQVYVSITSSVDATDQVAAGRADRMRGLASRISAATAFAVPEVLAIEPGRLRGWVEQDEELAVYRHLLDRLERQRPHVRSAEVEQVLGEALDALGAPMTAHNLLANADLRFRPARSSTGEEFEVAQGTVNTLTSSPDRELRRSAFESFADGHLAFKNTMAACLVGGVKRDIFLARARGYSDSLDRALKPAFLPRSVFENVISQFSANVGTWHRYYDVRRRALKLDRLRRHDFNAHLADREVAVPFQQAVEWISEGVSPLGADYVSILRRGVLEERWVDWAPNRGKRAGAFSIGTPDGHPYICMTYGGDVASMSTLAHELGHSMHSYYTRRNQPYVYHGYGLFAAEVASNFHQALVRAHLLQTSADRDLKIALLEEAMGNFGRYFLVMPTLAMLELEMHRRAEAGEGLTADDLTSMTADLFARAYGSAVEVDRDRVGITWAQFSTHLYRAFYTFQYATGIAGAHALAAGVLSGEPAAAERYLDFLRAGGSVYPLDALRLAGVDLESPEPIAKAFAVLAGLVDQLQELTT